MSINFLVVSYFAGLFVDWIFQSEWQATNKSKWGRKDNKWQSFAALITHSFMYAVLTTLVTIALLEGNVSHQIMVLIVLFVSHAIIDTRILVKLIMRFKGMSTEQIYNYQTYGFMHIGIDHRLHELVLVILAFFV
jgi:hypothetical protein